MVFIPNVEFTKRGVARKELKPVYLMLSGCETDMAKMAQASDSDQWVVSEYETAAKAWLQKVFGKIEAGPTDNGKPKTRSKYPLPTRPRALSNPKTAPPFDTERKRLEQEVRTLRARVANQASQISALRTSKRKLEDDIDYEQDLRRKVQREMEKTTKERDAAWKTEKYALIQVKREISSRRQAEARLQTVLSCEQ